MILDRILFASHLQDNEKLIYVVHSHWFSAYRPICKISFFGMLIPVLFYFMFPVNIALWIFGAWFLFGVLRFFHEVMDWYFDVFMITSIGVIDLDWRGIFDKSSQRIDFDTLVGVSFDKRGIWSNILNFGKFSIQSFGDSDISLPMAAAPQRAEREVMDAKENYSHERGMEDEKVLKEILAGMVQRHVRGEKEKKENRLMDMI